MTELERQVTAQPTNKGVGVNMYRPLQRWEYEGGLPVDGVSNAVKWTNEVGLAEQREVETEAAKKDSASCFMSTEKFAGTSNSDVEEIDDMQNDNLDEAKIERIYGEDTNFKGKETGKEIVEEK